MSKKTRKNSSRPTLAPSSAKKAAGKSRGKTGRAAGAAASGRAAARLPKATEAKRAVAASAAEPALREGSKAPDFTLPRDGGGSVSLRDFRGKNLVLFFYPRADTPGCTKEAIDFTQQASAFAKAGTAILGVSADPPKRQEAFRDKHELGIPLMSDERHEVLEAYGAWGEKTLYGRKFLGIIRTTVLIDADGRIARVWRNVRVDGHAGEVLAAAQTL